MQILNSSKVLAWGKSCVWKVGFLIKILSGSGEMTSVLFSEDFMGCLLSINGRLFQARNLGQDSPTLNTNPLCGTKNSLFLTGIFENTATFQMAPNWLSKVILTSLCSSILYVKDTTWYDISLGVSGGAIHSRQTFLLVFKYRVAVVAPALRESYQDALVEPN